LFHYKVAWSCVSIQKKGDKQGPKVRIEETHKTNTLTSQVNGVTPSGNFSGGSFILTICSILGASLQV